MNSPGYQARRAVLEDLPALRQLWTVEQLPALDLEKRFTEFQVAEGPDGQIVAALALQVQGTHGKVHSESFIDFGLTDTLRPLLWERVLSVARNRGLARLWTLESTLFWRGEGFQPPAPDLVTKVPANFGDPGAEWITLKLKDELLSSLTPEQEFALFKESVQQDTEKMMQQARMMKWVATVAAVIFFIVVTIAGINLIRYMNMSKQRGNISAPAGRR